MADGGLKIELDEGLSERLRVAAEASGRPVRDFAKALISQGLDDGWAEDYARYDEYLRTGEYVDAEIAMKEFRAAIAARFAAK